MANEKSKNNQLAIDRYNVQATKDQAQQTLGNYDQANRQSKKQAQNELAQNKRATEVDRFQDQRLQQAAALGLLGSMNTALNGSSAYNFIDLFNNRQDQDNVNQWANLQKNQDTVNNALTDTLNQNQVAKNDALINAEFQLKSQQANSAANLNNLNQDWFVQPGTGDTNFGGEGYYERNKVPDNYAELSGYIMPDNSRQEARQVARPNRLHSNDYWSRLMNARNGLGGTRG